MDLEQVKDLVEHLAVLRRDADAGLEIGLPCEQLDQRSHLDGFRTRPKNSQYFHFHSSSLSIVAATLARKRLVPELLNRVLLRFISIPAASPAIHWSMRYRRAASEGTVF